MSLLRLKNISMLLSQRRLIPTIQSSLYYSDCCCNICLCARHSSLKPIFFSITGSHVRFFASVNDRRKNIKNHGMVNKNREKRLDKEEPNLTIYPFAPEELKELEIVTETTPKINANKSEKIAKPLIIETPKESAQNKKVDGISSEIHKKAEEIVK